ncbi:MAG: glycosyltransferase [Patescibacteria group bacterium]
MIPKIIHYIWLGPNDKPKSFDSVLEGWKTHGKGFEIREWNEKDAEEFDLPDYYHRAIADKKWAFASDVLRVHILYRYGGFYFDTDQVLIRDIPESFLQYAFFTAYFHEVTTYFGFQYVGTAMGSSIMQKIIQFYAAFETQKDKPMEYIIINKILSDLLNAEIAADADFYAKNNIHIFPQEYFYPLNPEDFNDDTYSYHLGNSSWIPWYKKALYKIPFYLQIKAIILKTLPKKLKEKIKNNITY